MDMTRTIEIPVRMLHAVGVAAKENTRFSMDAVLIDVSCEHATIAAVATDGRCMVVAEWGKGLYDADERLVVPGDVARSAAKLATQAAVGDPEPMASLSCSEGRACEVKVLTNDGVAVLSWQETDVPFPPYRDVIPDWSGSTGVATIGITPELLAKALKTLQKMVGEDTRARVYLPSELNRPLGFEASDDTLKVLAIVMPANIGEWLEKPQAVKGEKKAAAAEDDETEPLPFAEKKDRRGRVAVAV